VMLEAGHRLVSQARPRDVAQRTRVFRRARRIAHHVASPTRQCIACALECGLAAMQDSQVLALDMPPLRGTNEEIPGLIGPNRVGPAAGSARQGDSGRPRSTHHSVVKAHERTQRHRARPIPLGEFQPGRLYGAACSRRARALCRVGRITHINRTRSHFESPLCRYVAARCVDIAAHLVPAAPRTSTRALARWWRRGLQRNE
jgi:hypothetical protein